MTWELLHSCIDHGSLFERSRPSELSLDKEYG